MSISTSKRHYYCFDILNIIASFAVVVLHCNGSVHTYSPTKTWAASLIIEVFFFWAVPVFFMLTGAKTLNYRDRYSTGEFLSKRMLRIFCPFLAWSLILYFLRFGVLGKGLGSLSLLEFITLFMNNGIEPTYWFFFSMFGITLSIPVLSLLIKNRRIVRYMILSAFIFSSFIPYLFAFVGMPWNKDITICVVTSYSMYVLLGFALSNPNCSLENSKYLWLTIGSGICLAIRYGYTLYSSHMLGEVDRLLFDYGAFTAVLPSIWIFVSFLKLEHWFERFSNSFRHLIQILSNAAFGIYLVHKVLLDNILCGLFGFSMFDPLFRLWAPFVVYLGSFALVYGLKKIPLVKTIVP